MCEYDGVFGIGVCVCGGGGGVVGGFFEVVSVFNSI